MRTQKLRVISIQYVSVNILQVWETSFGWQSLLWRHSACLLCSRDGVIGRNSSQVDTEEEGHSNKDTWRSAVCACAE